MNTVDDYIERFDLEIQTKMNFIRELIIESSLGFQESIKYKIPFFKLNHNVCFMAYTKAKVLQVGFWQGFRMTYSQANVTSHELKIVRHFNFEEFSDAEYERFLSVLSEAIEIDKLEYETFISIFKKNKNK